MDWEKLVQQIPTIIEKVKTDFVLNNVIIYEEMRLTLEAMNSPKQVEKEEIAKNEVYY